MKKIILIASFLGVLAFFITAHSDLFKLCSTYNDSCISYFDVLSTKFVIFLPLFFFSLMTSFMRDRVFNNWLYFAAIWVPIDLLVDFLMPEDHIGGSWALPNFGAKAQIMLFLWLGFCIISILIILGTYSYLWLKKK